MFLLSWHMSLILFTCAIFATGLLTLMCLKSYFVGYNPGAAGYYTEATKYSVKYFNLFRPLLVITSYQVCSSIFSDDF